MVRRGRVLGHLVAWSLLTAAGVLAVWLTVTVSLSLLGHERLPTVLASRLSADYSGAAASSAPLDPAIVDAVNHDRRPSAANSNLAFVPIFIAGRGNEAPATSGVGTPPPAAAGVTPTVPPMPSPTVRVSTRTPGTAATPQGAGGSSQTPTVGPGGQTPPAGGRPATPTPPPAATPRPSATPPGTVATPPPAPQSSPGGGPPAAHGRP